MFLLIPPFPPPRAVSFPLRGPTGSVVHAPSKTAQFWKRASPVSHTRSSPGRPFAVVALAAVLPLALMSCSGNRAEINAVCDDVHIEAEAVRLAADSVHQEAVVDGIVPQDQHLEYLDDHYEDMRYL